MIKKLQMKKIGKFRQSMAGFTLVELLVFMVLLSLIGLAFLGLQYMVTRNQATAWSDYLNIDEANKIVSVMVRELRQARESDLGDYLLVTANDQEIIFYSDYDFDDEVERIRYTLSGTTLTKGIIEPTGSPITYPLANEKVITLTENIRNGAAPVFTYYNKDWPIDTTNNPLPVASRISETQLVEIDLRFNPKDADPEGDYVLDNEARLRMVF